MSNNLRQIARDLRSFVKRCKDVHYSDSLLISFLITGLLTIAPKLHADVADVASEQQEVTAQTYDAITDLRQSFMRARKENEKSLKGAQSELVQLLRQGDQVIKSPWSSFQFGTGYMNNDWGTTYRGRGGKFLEYYKRDNDLTKYVFDPTKHLYGATNLNIPRNKEPNSLTINPANIHEPYKPYVPERLDNINGPKDVNFTLDVPTSKTWVKPANYVQNGTSTSYVTLQNINSNNNNVKTWGNSTTFDHTTSKFSAFDGMYTATANNNQYHNLSVTSYAGTSTSNHAVMNNGAEEGPHTNYRNNVTTGHYYTFWRPWVTWNSTVQYYGLATTPITNGTNQVGGITGTVGDDQTPTSNVNSGTGYDGIYNATKGWWWYNNYSYTGNYWDVGNYAENIRNFVDANKGQDVFNKANSNYNYLYATGATRPVEGSANVGTYQTGGTGTKWDNIPVETQTITPHLGTPYQAYTVTGGRKLVTITAGGVSFNRIYSNDANGARQYALDVAEAEARDFYANNWSRWYNDYNDFYSGGTAFRRDELILTNGTTDTKFINVNIGNTSSLAGGSFLKALGGATVTSQDVDVSIHNGNGAAYVISPGNAGTVSITFNADNSNSIANFDTTNGTIDPGGLTGSDNNIAFNFQDGYATESSGVTNDITIAGPVDIRFRGKKNIVYNMISASNDLKIINGKSATTSDDIKDDNLYHWNDQLGGRIFTAGDNNVVYNGYGAAMGTGSKLALSDVQMQGTNNIMVNLQGPNGQNSAIGRTGIFNGDIYLQGAFGGTHAATGAVAVYAASGQNSEAIGGGSIIAGGDAINLNNIKVKALNVGFHPNASNGVSVYAINGSSVEVGEEQSKTAVKTITDGLHGASTVDRGYDKIKLADVASNHIMGYAAGEIDDIKSGLIQGRIVNKPSKIEFKDNVDVMSKDGRAFVAVDGGEIELASGKNVRAAGSGTVVAYADGYENATSKHSAFNSKVKITSGNITAADWLTLGDDGTTNNYNINDSTANSRTYNNIGAYAINGGEIEINGTTASTSVQEAGGATANSKGSLIYGVGAVAKNNASVKMENVTVIDNEYGALYGENNGRIEFKGNIVNQNNNNPSGTISPDTTNATVNSDTRHAKSTSTANTHTGVSPFYVKRFNNGNDQSSITFTGTTNIDMYDGILLTGNIYNGNGVAGATNIANGDNQNREFDYAKDAAEPSSEPDKTIWGKAKYRGMSNVTANILTDNVVLGVINQSPNELIWNKAQLGGTGVPGTPTTNFLSGVGAYAGNMVIKNIDKHKPDVSVINSQIKVTGQDINIEDIEYTKATATPATDKNDPFNSIKMESDFITFDSGVNVKGAANFRDLKDYKGNNNANYQVQNVGFAMANSLSRWSDPRSANATWMKTSNEKSGFKNLGKIDFWGGSKESAITGLLVNFGTIQNGDGTTAGVIRIDHGNALVGTDGSVINNMKNSEITVTGKFKKPTTNPPTVGFNATRPEDSTPSGHNYGIVGISDTNNVPYNYADLVNHSGVDNSITIKHEDAKIYVEGDQATGIYAENRGDGPASGTRITYINSAVGTTGIDVSNNNVSSPDARGIGIALVNSNTNYTDGYTRAGGIIELKGGNGTLGSFASAGSPALTPGTPGGTTLSMGGNDIYTGKNGVGIYAESADISLDSKNFTVETADNGVGLWAMDDSHVAPGANHQKTFQYNYHGANDKNGFAMAFGGKNVQVTKATNDLDIKFTNNATSPVDLAYEQAKSKVAAVNGGTYKGIAGILVNTNDGADTVTNRGNIEEDSSSKTNVRAYGAVVNKGTFVNFGKIKLNDSLDAQADTLTSEDMKKVNVGIFANSTNKLDTTITNRGDITIGDSTNNKNIGSWAIYGYNVNTDSKEDGTKSKITINRNNYGIYSGDGNVNIKNTKLLVGNDTVLGHVQTTSGVSTAPGAYPINRQTAYANANDLLSGLDKPRELDSAIGVYIDKGSVARNINVSADMDIDRFSYGIVMAEKNGGPATNVTIGDGAYTLDASGKVSSLTATDAPTVVLASNRTAGGQVKSTAPSNPKVPEETKEQGNAVYYYSADTASRGKSWANVTMNGDYNTAYYTKGSMDNFGTIDLRSKYDVDNNNTARGYGNVGIFSANTSAPSTNYGTITTGMSDTVNMEYSAAMAAGRNHYKTDGNFDKTTEEGYIVNRGNIIVKEKEGIGMFATGAGSKAVNYGNIRLEGESAIGMYLDRGAIGENYGEIEGNAQSLKGVVAINGGYIKNYGHINVTGSGSYGIVTDGSRFIVDANGNPTEVLKSTDSRYTSSSAVTAGQTNGNGGTDLYGGKESSIEEGTSGNPKTTGVGTTITAPDIVPITKVSVDGIDTPIFDVESDAANPGDWAKNITVSSSIQTGGTRIIDLSVKNEWGNPVWEHAYKDPLSEVTSIGMYVDTSGVRYTNPIDGIQNLPKLGKVDLYFGPEATLYTNSKAIRIGDKVDVNGNVTKSNILKPFNDALSRLPGGAKVNVLSASLTWQVLAKLDSNNQLSEIYMSKVPYHSFAYDNDKSLVNFTNNLDNIYEIARQESAEKVIFNKLNSLGNGEGHILAQAFDQMRGHIYGGVQQRIKSTSDILGGEISSLRSERNVSKDSNKFKAFGQRNEFKTDTAGMPDWYSNAGGFAFVHEDETVRLGQSSGWSAGVVNNYFTFKDLSKSYENQAMAKVGVFKSIPLDANGTFILSLGGDGFFGRNDMKRRFWVVDQQFRAKASYYSYGAGLNAGLEKSFVVNDGFSIVPNLGIRAEYGRFSSIHEKGDMALNVKSDDYVSVKPSVGIDFRYNQEVFKNSNLTASLGFAYENEIGKLYDVENEARIVGAWTDYFGIRGDKEDKRGNFKSDLKLGLDNGRFGFNVNTGYDSKGHNFRAGLGLKVLY